MGEKELKILVDNNESFYKLVQKKAPAMRMLIVTEFASVDMRRLSNDGIMYLFAEVMTDLAPRFTKVVTWDWLVNELSLIAEDVENAKKS